ncbi:uncharacterized protein [Rutidosis leptorrhynchoides]|uniref:uncharacterized protein isoform X2 n=1 Tax=Rutidosis leptorrhynchoides TaxID=125765 RepID=UPI003A99356C
MYLVTCKSTISYCYNVAVILFFIIKTGESGFYFVHQCLVNFWDNNCASWPVSNTFFTMDYQVLMLLIGDFCLLIRRTIEHQRKRRTIQRTRLTRITDQMTG